MTPVLIGGRDGRPKQGNAGNRDGRPNGAVGSAGVPCEAKGHRARPFARAFGGTPRRLGEDGDTECAFFDRRPFFNFSRASTAAAPRVIALNSSGKFFRRILRAGFIMI